MKNILLITIDCLRKDSVNKKLTPFLWRLSKKGINFKNCFSLASWTLPSFKGIMTSTYPLMHKGELKLCPPMINLTEVLQRNRYGTVGLLYHPYLHRYFGYNKGFDYFFDEMHDEWKWGNRKVRNFADWLFKNLKNKEILEKLTFYYSLYFLKNNLKTGHEFHLPVDKINKNAIDLLKENRKRPYFYWLHYLDAHFPYLPSNTNLSEKEIHRLNLLREQWYRGGKKVNKKDLRKLKRLYECKVKEIDNALKVFFEKLDKERLLRNTAIIITSDHGEEFNEHGEFHHEMNLYDELTHIPLVILAPGLKSQKITKMTSQIDLAPTILDLVRINKPKEWLGQSLLDKENKKNYAISEEGQRLRGQAMRRNFTLDLNYKRIAIRTKKVKYIYNQGGEDELYDLRVDPKEKKNIINQGVPRPIERILDRHLKRIEKTEGDSV